MACFLVPAAAGVITAAIRKKMHKRYRTDILNAMLWGGVVMLAIEHIAHKEIVLYPPFLTAGLSEVIPEMIKIGLPMTIVIFFVWAVIIAISEIILKKEAIKAK